MNTSFGRVIFGMILGTGLAEAAVPPLVLHYKAPASETAWASQALPLGNGRLGCMLFGGPFSEQLQFNV
ncbi:MAG: glycoside hydrolase N-terminal domain-containing protein, partial [bacterium]